MSKQRKKTSRLTARTNKQKLASVPQQIKILAGCWRGSKLPVLRGDDVRPTPSRVRETLFNWLQQIIVASDCLDLFAGSGALGFEAVSRGANSATLVDSDQQIIQLLSKQVDKFDTQKISIIRHDGLQFVQNCNKQFDIVFLDPPFSKYPPSELVEVIINQQVLTTSGLIYIEYAANQKFTKLPEGWQWKRQSQAGGVQYGLIASH